MHRAIAVQLPHPASRLAPPCPSCSGGLFEITIPQAAFVGATVPYIVTVQVQATNAIGVVSALSVASSPPTTVGLPLAPTSVTAAPNAAGTAVEVSYTPGDTTCLAAGYRIETERLGFQNQTLSTAIITPTAATSPTAQQSYTIVVGAAANQLPTGRYKLRVTATNANSPPVRRWCCRVRAWLAGAAEEA